MPPKALDRHSSSQSEQGQDLLQQLRVVATNLAYFKAERDRLIRRALAAGLSERQIAPAARLSNVSIHNRRRKSEEKP